MIDQEKQAIFTGQISQYSITFRMKEKSFVIIVEDQETLKSFQKVIDQQFINNQDMFFKVNFESPEDIFTYLSENFSQIVVEKGFLRFGYTSGIKKIAKEMSFELDQQQMDQRGIAELKMAKIKQHFKTELEQRDERITALGLEIRELAFQFRKCNKENEERRQVDQQKIKKLEERLEKDEEKIKQLEEMIQRMDDSSLKISKDNSKEKQKELAKQQKFLYPPSQIAHHKDNSHKDYYILTNSNINSAILQRNEGDINWYNFVNKTQIMPKQKARYAIKIIQASCNYLYIGFCTRQGLGNNRNFKYSESAYYYCYGSGYLCQDGYEQQLSDAGSRKGDVVECMIDLLQEKICWQKEGKVLAECKLPQSMKGRPIYLSIEMRQRGDSVEIRSL